MTRKPRIGNFKELKFKKIPGGAYPRTRLDAWAFGARLGNRSLFILDPRLNRLTTVKLFRLNLGYPISPKHPKSFQSSTQRAAVVFWGGAIRDNPMAAWVTAFFHLTHIFKHRIDKPFRFRSRDTT